jgi:ankyrin repeat protein
MEQILIGHSRWWHLRKLDRLSCEEIKKLDQKDECKVLLYIYYGYNDEFIKYYHLHPEILNIKFKTKTHIYLYACWCGNQEIVSFLENKIENIYNIVDFTGMNAFLNACESGNLELVKYFENNGFNLEFTSYNNMNGYLCAMHNGTNIANYLESRGVDCYVSTTNGTNAYLIAASYGNIPMLQYLEKHHNFNINYVDLHGDNAYLWAVWAGEIPTLKYLETHGIDVYKYDENGKNAFVQSVEIGGFEVVKYLYDKKIYDNFINSYTRCHKI